jgi:hypothetical protein
MAILRIEPNIVDSGGSFTFNNVIATSNVSAAGYYWANGQPFVSSTYSNVNVAAYLAGNVTTGNVSAAGYYWANGTPFSSSSFSNVILAAYLAGNVAVGNLVASGNITGGGVRTTTSATSPTNPTVGDMWYNTNDDTIYRYSNNGTSNFWLDINGPITLTNNTDIVANSLSVLSIQANLGSYQTWSNLQIVSLQTNAATQSTAIDTTNANVTAANAAIVTANSAVVSYVNTLNSAMVANATAANAAIGVLQSNAASQATTITALSGNVQFTVTNSGASSYLIDGVANSTISLIRGITYTFNVSATGHPFWIKTAATTGTGDAYSTGVTNNGSDSGTITFTVPLDAPDLLYYICQFHGTMKGNINIIGSLTTIGGDVSRKANIASPVFTGVTTISGLLTANDTATFAGTSANSAAKFTNVKEAVYIIASAPSATQTVDVSSGAVQYFTSNATTNWTFNIRFSSGTATNTAMAVGDSITVSVLTSQGASSYFSNTIQVDGTTAGVNARWSPSLPTAGHSNSIDVYTFSVIKTATTPTFTVLASQTKFG